MNLPSTTREYSVCRKCKRIFQELAELSTATLAKRLASLPRVDKNREHCEKLRTEAVIVASGPHRTGWAFTRRPVCGCVPCPGGALRNCHGGHPQFRKCSHFILPTVRVLVILFNTNHLKNDTSVTRGLQSFKLLFKRRLGILAAQGEGL